MAIHRQSIVRRDFPAAPDGYERAAVDAHLAAIAAHVEDLGAAASAPAPEAAVRALVASAEAADALRGRIDALDRELGDLVTAARSGVERLRRDLDAAVADAARLARGAAAGPTPAGVAPSARGATLGETPIADAVDEEVGEEPALAAVEEAPSTARRADVEGAMLVALSLKTSGATREEADRYLAEHYDLEDRAALLERVFAPADGH